MDRAEIILSSITDAASINTDNSDDKSKTVNKASREIKLDTSFLNSSNSKSKVIPHASSAIEVGNDVNDLWKKSCNILNVSLDSQIFLAWIKPLKPINFIITPGENPGSCFAKLTLGAPNKFCCNHVLNEYQSEILDAASEVSGVVVNELNFEIVRTKTKAIPKPSLKRSSLSPNFASSEKKSDVRRIDTSNLNPRYNFSNYVVGTCNQFANAACIRVAENLGRTYNPLFIYGGVGLGKTHLANAIGNSARKRNKKVLLVSSETFVSELITSLRTNRMDKFKSKFRSLDLLIVDDIQFIIGKMRTQEEFFHTFNELHNNHSQIIITSDKMPQGLDGLDERLKTRFASGLTVDLQNPDFETRVSILKKKSEQYKIDLPDDVARLMAERIDTNVRELEGALNRLTAYCSLNSSQVSCRIAREVIETIAPSKTKEITSEYIQKIVAERYNLEIKDLIGKRRTQNIALARQIAMFLARELTGSSYPELGAVFGGRDHSTVIHAVKVINERIKKSNDFSDEVSSLRKSL